MKYGFPLYYPEPPDNLPLELRMRGVSIGDVGVLKADESKFHFAFNIFAPGPPRTDDTTAAAPTTPMNEADRTINYRGVPDDFVPLQFNTEDVQRMQNKHARKSELMSEGVEKHSGSANVNVSISDGSTSSIAGFTMGYNVSSSKSESAVLTMPHGAMSEDYENTAAIRTYCLKNAVSWYRFINETLGRDALNGSVYVVTGCDKSKAWGIATTGESSSSQSLSLQFNAKFIAASAGYECSWSSTGRSVQRVSRSPTDLAPGVKQPENQCLFIRGYKVMLREGLVVLRNRSETAEVENITSFSDVASLLRTKGNSFPGASNQNKSLFGRLGTSFGGGKAKGVLADSGSSTNELDSHVDGNTLANKDDILGRLLGRYALSEESG
ncbi:hypothetical protein HWV62_29046 [Athelia sp. TMB]|nr:hypothetical protein HWV62_29046 [Athelia sp. TMB]